LEHTGDILLVQDDVSESPDGEMLRGRTCPLHATNPASNTGAIGQNGQSSSTTARGTASGSETVTKWRVKLRAIRTAIVQGEDGSGRKSCRVARPLVQGMRWIGQRCMCEDKDEDGTIEEPIRQGIRLVQV
jgi:hypothetical protein